MSKRMTWDEIVEKYPDQWVVLDDVKYISEDDDINIESALVVQVVTDELSNDVRHENNRKGLRYIYRRTTEYYGFMGAALEFYTPPVRETWNSLIKDVPSGYWLILSDTMFEADGVTVKSAYLENIIEEECLAVAMRENEEHKFNLTFRKVP